MLILCNEEDLKYLLNSYGVKDKDKQEEFIKNLLNLSDSRAKRVTKK